MSKINIELAGALSRLAGEKKVVVNASILKQALEELASLFGDVFTDKLFDEGRKPRRFINIYINGRDYRFINQLDTELREGDTVTLIPAVSGG